jgi:CubicO group peptidase (beta-lactamase class C family)
VNISSTPEQRIYIADTPPTLESGGGGLVSTVHDYFRFCQMLLNEGTLDGRMVLSAKTVQWISSNHLPDHKTMRDVSLLRCCALHVASFYCCTLHVASF